MPAYLNWCYLGRYACPLKVYTYRCHPVSTRHLVHQGFFHVQPFKIKFEFKCQNRSSIRSIITSRIYRTIDLHTSHNPGPRSIAETVWSRKWGFCPDAISRFLSGLYPAYLKIRKFVRVGGSGGFSTKIRPDLQIWPFQGVKTAQVGANSSESPTELRQDRRKQENDVEYII